MFFSSDESGDGAETHNCRYKVFISSVSHSICSALCSRVGWRLGCLGFMRFLFFFSFLPHSPRKNLLCNLLYPTKPYTPSNYHLLHSVHSVAFGREAAPEAPETVRPDRLEPGASRCPLVSILTVIATEITAF